MKTQTLINHIDARNGKHKIDAITTAETAVSQLYFDEGQKSINDKFVPLDKETGQPHQCSEEKDEENEGEELRTVLQP